MLPLQYTSLSVSTKYRRVVRDHTSTRATEGGWTGAGSPGTAGTPAGGEEAGWGGGGGRLEVVTAGPEGA